MLTRSPLTPWVRRLLVANAVVYLLTITVFTGPWFFDWFAFSPALVLQQPWTLGTYMFVHGGFFHLAFNMLMLFFFGTALEGRMGGTEFARYYFFCGLGGAALSYVFMAFSAATMVVGASAAIFGVALAFALYWPDQKIYIFPLPVPIKVKWLVMGLAALDLLSAMVGANDGVAHFAHLGGFAFGFGYLRWGPTRSQRETPAVSQHPVRVLAHPTSLSAEHSERQPRPQAGSSRPAYDEVDRVLDKISETGLDSLTKEERRLLDDMSQRLRGS